MTLNLWDLCAREEPFSRVEAETAPCQAGQQLHLVFPNSGGQNSTIPVPDSDCHVPLLQFCTAVRKIVCSRASAYLTALCGVGVMLYLGCLTPTTALLTLLVSFTIWMAA